jgi:NAD(P)-dependent dehydrogenase (short-subunit alcohol dehydrogenase family)
MDPGVRRGSIGPERPPDRPSANPLDKPLVRMHRDAYRHPIPTKTASELLMNASNHPIENLRVAITGGTSGLGLALVKALHAQGAKVAFIARDVKQVGTVVSRLPGVHGIVGDVSWKLTTHALAIQVTSALGGLDVLINNASSLGPVPLAPLADTECEDFEAALATNLVGPFRLSKALLGALASSAREGRTALIVNITSDAAVSAYANWGAYGASKAGLAHMSRIWDEELREHGVRVIAHDPGDMDTPLHAQALPDADPATLKRPADAATELIDRITTLMAREEVSA